MSAAVVYYIKHWDNDTKGSIEFSDVVNLAHATNLADRELTAEAHQALIDGEWDVNKLDAPYTITKAELVDSVRAYAGVPKAAF